MYKVFVYGSLKKGFGNHRLLENSHQDGTGYINNLEMFSLGGFPGVHKTSKDIAVSGELYNVDEYTFKRLDWLEGNPTFYKREQMDVYDPTNNKLTKAWVYIYQGYNSHNDNRVMDIMGEKHMQAWV